MYKSTDSGRTWALMQTLGNINPLYGAAISKMVVDPSNPNLPASRFRWYHSTPSSPSSPPTSSSPGRGDCGIKASDLSPIDFPVGGGEGAENPLH